MVPAKNRERKCSTCKHYQASPLWRKGWCRNPLLYDRNTNHLVEADSLACNRTFIDYWEPLDERNGAQTGTNRSTGTTGPKPRIAPSIPMETVDATGAAISKADSASAMGSTAQARSRKPLFKPLTSAREQARPPLSLVDEAYDELEDPKVTQKMPQVDRKKAAGMPMSSLDRIREARIGRGLAFPQLSGRMLWMALGALGLLIVVVAALLLTRRGDTPTNNNSVATEQVVVALPSPTGLGDARPSPTTVAGATASIVEPPVGEIAVNGYAKVSGTGAQGLIIRPGPTTAGDKRVTKVSDGTRLHIIDGPEKVGEITWWKVDGFDPKSPTTSGWCSGTYLIPTAAP